MFAPFLTNHHPRVGPLPHKYILINNIEIGQRRAAHLFTIGQLHLEQLNIRRTNRRLTIIFHKTINGHLALPLGNLQPVLRHTRHLNNKAFNIIHTSKDCYTYSSLPQDNNISEFTARQNGRWQITTNSK